MSLKAMAGVWNLDVEPTLKLTLLALADYADSNGIAWPSYPTLAARVGVSERQLARLVGAAEKAGYLVRQPGNGRGNPTRYRLTVKVDTGDTVTADGKVDTGGVKVDTGDAKGRHSYVSRTVTEPLLEPLRTPRAKGKHEISEALRQARTAIDPTIFRRTDH